TGGFDCSQSDEAADAVIGVNHNVTGRKRRGFGDEIGRPALTRAAHQPVAKNILLGNDNQIIGFEPGFQWQHGKRGLAGTQLAGLVQRLDALKIAQVVLGKYLRQPVERAFSPASNDDSTLLRALVSDVAGSDSEHIGVGVGAFLGEAATRTRARMKDLAPPGFGRRKGRELHLKAVSHGRADLVRRQVHRLRGNRLVGHGILQRALRAARIIVVEYQLVTLAERLMRQVVEDDRRVRQIVEYGLQPFVKEGQPVLHACEAATFAHRGVERVITGRRSESLYVSPAKAADRVGRQRHLAHRLQEQLAALADRALAGGIDGADRFQHVAEEIQSQRFVGAGSEEVHYAAADGEFADLAHRRHALEAGVLQPPYQLFHVQLIAGLGAQRLSFDQSRGWNPLQQRVGGRQYNGAVGSGGQRRHAGQCIQPARGGIGSRRNTIIRQAVPRRQVQNRQIRRSKGERLDDGWQTLPVARDEDDG